MCLLIAFLAEAVNNMGGLGFSGFDENGIAKWDRLTIVNVLRLEVLQYNITLSSILHVPCGCSDDDDGDGDYDDRSNCPDKPRIVDFVKISEYYQNDICNREIDSYALLSFAFFHTVCNKFKGSFRQLEYLYSVVVKKVG